MGWTGRAPAPNGSHSECGRRLFDHLVGALFNLKTAKVLDIEVPMLLKLRNRISTHWCISANRRDVPQHSAKKLALSPFNLGTG
jgi:hypothetical protein